MKPLLLVPLSIILLLTNVAGAVIILSENYVVAGGGGGCYYSESSSVPPITCSCGCCNTTADYFNVYAFAFGCIIYEPDPSPVCAVAGAEAIYEIRPTDNYLQIEIGNPWSYDARGIGGFRLFDQTDNVLIADDRWLVWSAKQVRLFYYPVDIEHQYEFRLIATADASPYYWYWESFIRLTGSISSVPEPTTVLLVGFGGLVLLNRPKT